MRTATALAATLAALLTVSAWGQTLNLEGLPEITELLIAEQLAARSWHLNQDDFVTKYSNARAQLAANGLRAGMGYSSVGPVEAQFVRAFGPTLAPAVDGFISLGGHHTGIFTLDNYPPVRFFKMSNQAGVLFSSVGVGVDFNTFNSNELDRMRTVVFDMIVPRAASAGRVVGETELSWLGVSVFYGIRDFTNDRDRGEVEAVIAIFPMRSVNEYRRHEITDLDLVLGAVVFGSSGMTLLRRISLYR